MKEQKTNHEEAHDLIVEFRLQMAALCGAHNIPLDVDWPVKRLMDRSAKWLKRYKEVYG